MKTVTATQAARNFSRLLDMLENGSEEIVVVRKKRAIAKMIPGAPQLNALEALADLYRTLPDTEAKRWLKDARKIKRRWREEKRDPWE